MNILNGNCILLKIYIIILFINEKEKEINKKTMKKKISSATKCARNTQNKIKFKENKN